MPTPLTLKNIPDEVYNRLRRAAETNRRSLNSELLVVLEEGLTARMDPRRETTEGISPAGRERLWNELCGIWKDKRNLQEQISGILSARDGVITSSREGQS